MIAITGNYCFLLLRLPFWSKPSLKACDYNVRPTCRNHQCTLQTTSSIQYTYHGLRFSIQLLRDRRLAKSRQGHCDRASRAERMRLGQQWTSCTPLMQQSESDTLRRFHHHCSTQNHAVKQGPHSLQLPDST